MHVKTGDMVVLIAGKERGEKGRILKVLPRENRVIVEGRNIIKRHMKPNPLIGREGGIIEREAPIHASNVALYSEKLEGPVRAQKRFVGADEQLYVDRQAAIQTFEEPPAQLKKVRYCPKTEEIFE